MMSSMLDKTLSVLVMIIYVPDLMVVNPQWLLLSA